MTIKKLLKELSGILNEDRRVQPEKYKSLKKLLKALRKEKVILEESLTKSDDKEKRHEIKSRLKIISAQRKKGLKVLEDSKNEKANL